LARAALLPCEGNKQMKCCKLIIVVGIALAMLAVLEIGLVTQQARAEMLAEPRISPAQGVTISGCLSSDQFQPVLNEFTSRTGITVQYENMQDEEPCDQNRIRNCTDNDTCPDVAILPWPSMLAEFGEAGALVDLSTFISSTVLNANYADTWIDLGKVDGTLYGVWFNAGNKSVVWHDPTEFTAHGWATPTTWVDMLALSEQISDTTGTPPWSIGNESGPATGWPLTDWFENILLRSAGPDIYDDLVAHDIPWTHTEVLSAMTYFGDIFGNEGYQLGGKSGTTNTFFLDAIYPPFEEPPRAYLHHQGSWAHNAISSQFPTQMAGVDYAVFPFPDIGSVYTNAVMGGGDIAMMFSDTAEVQSLLDFLITTDAAEIWVQGGNTSPNRNADTSLYPDPNTRAAAEYLINADLFRFDLTDQLPVDLNAYVLSQMEDLVHAAPDPAAMEEVLARIEFKASYPYGIYIPLVVRDFGL
jgi:alpha-glucoside transport system substrate-binding protein